MPGRTPEAASEAGPRHHHEDPLGEDPDEEGLKARDRALHALARGMYGIGLRPNHLTLLQVPVYAIMIWEGIHGHLIRFGLWQLVIMVLDGMDGTLARRMDLASRSGAILDAVFDLFGIVVVIGVAAYVHPEYTWWLVVLLATNLLLYGQNYQLDEKAVSYVRGPIVVGQWLELHYPGVMAVAIGIPLVTSSLIILVRWATDRKEEAPPGKPEPYQPGFSLRRDG